MQRVPLSPHLLLSFRLSWSFLSLYWYGKGQGDFFPWSCDCVARSWVGPQAQERRVRQDDGWLEGAALQ